MVLAGDANLYVNEGGAPAVSYAPAHETAHSDHALALEHLSQRDLDLWVCCSENAVFRFVGTVGSVHIPTSRARIDHPYVLHTEGEVVVDLFLQILRPIFPGKDLDHSKRRLDYDPSPGFAARDHADVGNAKAGGFDLHTDFGPYPNSAIAGTQIRDDCSLQITLFDFPHVSLYDLSVNVLAVSVLKTGVEVFLHRKERPGAHDY